MPIFNFASNKTDDAVPVDVFPHGDRAALWTTATAPDLLQNPNGPAGLVRFMDEMNLRHRWSGEKVVHHQLEHFIHVGELCQIKDQCHFNALPIGQIQFLA